MIGEREVTAALLEIDRAAFLQKIDWSLIGGLALRAHGLPRDTDDADAFVPTASLSRVATTLVETFGWTPLRYERRKRDYVRSRAAMIHYMDDPVLFDVHAQRQMVPLRTQLGLLVELLAAQHPIERRMILESKTINVYGVNVPLAPLGGILTVKMKANRGKDLRALEQAAEHIPADQLRKALAWSRKHDPSTAEEIESLMKEVHLRRVPKRTTPVPTRTSFKKR